MLAFRVEKVHAHFPEHSTLKSWSIFFQMFRAGMLFFSGELWWQMAIDFFTLTVRSGAEERTFSGARLDVLIFRLRSYHVLNLVYCRC